MEQTTLSLQQKMVKIREKIPALVKKAYSEDVNYDFTKIDDIFRYLTPAMNLYGVNLDIESETASKTDEKGNPVYVEFLQQSQMWIYEADLGLRWIDADNPEDTIKVTIHAIGTHEMPEKAKGSAWTYSLKYYLLDKYCIDQGGEDPDMRKAPTPTKEGENWEQVYSSEALGEDENSYFEDHQQYLPEQTAFEEASEKNAGVQRQGSPHIRPESGEMVVLPESVKPDRPEEGMMTVEDACRVVCNFGLHNGESLGSLAQKGADGIKALHWFANDYRGRNEQIREGARLLLTSAEAA